MTPAHESSRPSASVVVPAKDEVGNLADLIAEIDAALAGRSFEVIVVDDGSGDGTDSLLADLALSRPWLRVIRHRAACGQSAAVRTGVLASRGEVVLTIDGDGQNDPAFFPDMLDVLAAGGPGMGLVAGQRVGRKASTAKRYASRGANWLRRTLLDDGIRDTGCGMKAVRGDIFRRLPFFDGWHRYLPALVIREGYTLGTVDVVDRPRRHGQSKYGIFDRALVGVLDLYGVWWLRRRFRRRPVATEVTPGLPAQSMDGDA